jgi:hypothetical protein
LFRAYLCRAAKVSSLLRLRNFLIYGKKFIMKMHAFVIRLSVASIAAGPFLSPVWAIHDGVCRSPGVVVSNPYAAGKTLEAWKLIGGGNCSGVRISKEWIMGSAHCFFNSLDSEKVTFTTDTGSANGAGSATVDYKTCADPVIEFGYVTQGVDDIRVCRLVDSGTLTEPASYPVLAVMPAFSAANAGRLGGMLIGGMARWPFESECPGDSSANQKFTAQFGLIDLNGMDISRGIVEPTTQSVGEIQPYVVDADSGGGAFWLPPNGQDPALVGVISLRKPGGLQNVPWFFTADNLIKVVAYIKRVGKPTDQIPVIRTNPDYFVPTGPANSPAMMTSKPTVVATSPIVNTDITVTWTAPVTTPVAIDGYRVTMAQNGGLAQTKLVGPDLPLSVSFPGLTLSANGRVCVTPFGKDAGLATSAYSSYHTINNMDYAHAVLPGCTEFTNEVPAGVTSLASVIASRTALSSTIRTSWLSRDSVAKVFRVKQTTTFRSGPKRVVTQDLTSTSLLVSVTKGATLCTEVTAISAIKLIASNTSTTCLLSN